MGSFRIEGGHKLKGEIVPQGAKNEAMQIICASLLTDEEVEQIKKYIEQGTILDVQFMDASGEVMVPTGFIPEVKNDAGEVTSNAYITVIKNGSIVKAEVTETIPAPVIKGNSTFTDSEKVTLEARGISIGYMVQFVYFGVKE